MTFSRSNTLSRVAGEGRGEGSANSPLTLVRSPLKGGEDELGPRT